MEKFLLFSFCIFFFFFLPLVFKEGVAGIPLDLGGVGDDGSPFLPKTPPPKPCLPPPHTSVTSGGWGGGGGWQCLGGGGGRRCGVTRHQSSSCTVFRLCLRRRAELTAVLRSAIGPALRVHSRYTLTRVARPVSHTPWRCCMFTSPVRHRSGPDPGPNRPGPDQSRVPLVFWFRKRGPGFWAFGVLIQ